MTVARLRASRVRNNRRPGHDGEMTWIAPAPSPDINGPLAGAERPMLEAYLASKRATVRAICAGLDGEQLARRSAPPSTLSLLGIVRHLAKVERVWFRQRVAGEESRQADAAAAAVSLDHTFVLRGETHSLLMVYLHMIAEYARHNGHADLLRESIDGVTGV